MTIINDGLKFSVLQFYKQWFDEFMMNWRNLLNQLDIIIEFNFTKWLIKRDKCQIKHVN